MQRPIIAASCNEIDDKKCFVLLLCGGTANIAPSLYTQNKEIIKLA